MAQVRPTMTDLISRLRDLIGDPAGAGSVFTDSRLQQALDKRRWAVRLLLLDPIANVLPGGQLQYLEFSAPYGDWETGELLQSGQGWATLTPATADHLDGRWTFATSQQAGVYLSGFTYDLYGSAGDLCLQRPTSDGSVNLVDFSEDGQSIKASQRKGSWRDQAHDFYRLARPRAGRLERSDMACP